MPADRLIRKPRKDFSSIALPVIELKGFKALRVHSKDHPEIGFRVVSIHRFSHPDAPGGLLYLGESIETCLWECFGDDLLDGQSRLSASRWMNSHLSKVHTTGSFKICDLANEKVRLALGVDLSALMHPDLSIPHAWGLALQNHPAKINGLRYLSRFNNKPCMVLFEQPGTASKLKQSIVGYLPDVDDATAFLVKRSISLV